MSFTLRLPESLHGGKVERLLKPEGATFAAGEPLVVFELDGKQIPLSADRGGAVLLWLHDPESLCGEGAPVAILGEPGESIGYHPSSVLGVRMLLLRNCAECGNDYPLNGLVEKARCTRCGDIQRASAGYWRDYVLEHVDAASVPRAGSSTNVLGGKHGKASIQCWGIPPLCRKCFAIVDFGALNQAWQEAQGKPSTTITCTACAEPLRARMPPVWAAEIFPKLAFLIGETADLDETGEPPKPVVFKCASCLAALQIDGVKRIVHCRYCESDVYLPDDLWLHFHPASKRARWWMLLRP